MSLPPRISVVTFNIWNTARWDVRESVLRAFVRKIRPDVFCLQELRPESQACLDESMPTHDRVRDDFPGWTVQSNIYWNRGFLSEIEHGFEDVGITEKFRGLFWVRLRLAGEDQSVFVSTAHFTYQGHPDERASGLSPRLEQTRRTIEALGRLVYPSEPALFMGDLNDPYLPVRMLLEAGYRHCFADLGIPTEPTHPCHPTVNVAPRHAAQTIDWIVANEYTRSTAAQVPHFFHGDIAPSDHWPVLAVYEIGVSD